MRPQTRENVHLSVYFIVCVDFFVLICKRRRTHTEGTMQTKNHFCTFVMVLKGAAKVYGWYEWIYLVIGSFAFLPFFFLSRSLHSPFPSVSLPCARSDAHAAFVLQDHFVHHYEYGVHNNIWEPTLPGQMPDDPYWIVTVAVPRIICCQFLHTIELVSNSCAIQQMRLCSFSFCLYSFVHHSLTLFCCFPLQFNLFVVFVSVLAIERATMCILFHHHLRNWWKPSQPPIHLYYYFTECIDVTQGAIRT